MFRAEGAVASHLFLFNLSRGRILASSFVAGLALTTASGAFAAPAEGCPGTISAARVNLARTTTEATEGRATRIDVENAKIGLVEARYACEAIPRGMFCREKDWSLSSIVRILENQEGVPGGDLAAAVERLRAHRAECPTPSAP